MDTIFPTVSLVILGLTGLSKFLIFSGVSVLTATLAMALVTLSTFFLVLRLEVGEWLSWKCLGIRDLAISTPHTGHGAMRIFLEGESAGLSSMSMTAFLRLGKISCSCPTRGVWWRSNGGGWLSSSGVDLGVTRPLFSLGVRPECLEGVEERGLFMECTVV